MINPPKQSLIDPKLMDLSIKEINDRLEADFSWLTCYGKCQTLVRAEERKYNADLVRYPAVYTKDVGYLSMLPDASLGSFSFWEFKEFGEADFITTKELRYKVEFGLIFWFDYRDIYPSDWEERGLDNVKFEVYNSLNKKGFRYSQVKIIRDFEKPRNIYNGWDHKEVERNFMMRPYGGFRIHGILTTKQKC